MVRMKDVVAIVLGAGVALYNGWPETHAQDRAALRFDAASIRAGATGDRRSMVVTPAGLTYTNVTLADCLEAAYGIRAHQVAGPGWIGRERYSIAARLAGAETPVMMQGLQTLLAERFALRLHWEERRLPVYALRRGKGTLRLTRVEHRGGVVPISGGMTFQGMTLDEFAGEFLAHLPTMDRPIVEETGLEGRYTFSLQMFDRDAPPVDLKNAVAGGGPDLFVHALEQIGLELHRESRAARVLVVDAANRVPIEN
jgi:uncharacterized protein (TIGR03435 family)